MKRRIVLLTGASSGIGEEIARQLVKRGDFPLLVARNARKLAALHHELRRGEVFPCDVTRDGHVKALVKEVIDRYERIDVLINNAGFGRFGGALNISMSDYAGMIDTNYLGAVRMTQAVLPHMLLRGNGRIINIASIAGLTGIPNLAAYCASKFALIGFSEALKLEYAPRIRVGVLCPGPVQTPFFRGEDPRRLFPGPIAGQLLDTRSVARHTVKLIDRPRLKVIPASMGLAMRMRHITPGVYFWAIKRLYDAHKKQQHVYRSNEEGTDRDRQFKSEANRRQSERGTGNVGDIRTTE